KETEYCLSVIPMGGYVKMMGEENPLEGGGGALPYEPGKAFALKPLWARFLIVFAGPGMNFVLAAVIFMLVFATVGRTVWPPVFGRVAESIPAAAAGLTTGELIGAVDGQPVRHWEDMDHLVSTSNGRPLKITIKRDNSEPTITVTPRLVTVRDPIFREPKESWELGVGPQLTPQIGSVTGGSAAEKAGLKPGDLVRAVADQPVFTPEELMQALQQRAGPTFQPTVGPARGGHATASRDRHRGQGAGTGRTGGRSRADRCGHRHPRRQLRSVFVAAGRLVRCGEDVGNDGDHGQRTVEDRHRGARSLEH